MPSFLAAPLKILLIGLSAVSILFCARLAGIGPAALLSTPGTLAALLVFLVGLGFAAFLWWLASRCFTLLRDPATTPEQIAALRDLPLALPEGTVRALLALIVGVIGLPLLLFSQALALNDAIAGYVNGIIAGVFGYYFGARSSTPEAQAARRLGDALEGQQRANETLRTSEAAARDAAARAGQPSRIAEAMATLERQLSVARILVQRLGPALPAGVIPPQAEGWLEDAERALGAARAAGGRGAGMAELGALQSASAALTGSGSPLASLLRAAAPLLPAAAGGPLAGVAMLLGLGWNLGSAAWRRFRAHLLEAPHDPALFEPGAITPASAELRLADAPVFARLFAPRLAEPGFLAGLLDTCLREDAAERLWARYPGFASPAEAAQGLAEFRRALLEDRVEADLSPDLVARIAQSLNGAAPGLRPAAAARAVLPQPGGEPAQAALQALALLLGELRESHTDPVPLLAELTP
ncbi:hypothetical protein EJV46_12405 [Roseococcus sp. SYP-B2431]|uniref:hypothetical protein n=1 Tax=Roseococcus sp. SYP-B2431 TaxID=2496640 RepID=UPI00103FA40B|nr:hypothetical protein [Roseococcus sp. SYP-B2431]TCH98008.1 hypothetical protein EJV46_12405 [Roseococcus sp. SYP-B2431]